MSRGKSTQGLAIGQIVEPRVRVWAGRMGASLANAPGIPQLSASLNQFVGHMPDQMIDNLVESGGLHQLTGRSSGLSKMNHQQLNEFWIDQGFGEQNITTSKGAKNPWNEALWEDGDLETRASTIGGLSARERETLSSQEGAWEPTSTTASAPNTAADELRIA